MESRVYLRALEVEDYKTTINWRNDDEIWDMVGGPKYFVSSEYEKNWIIKAINNTNEIRLGICLKENDLLIGMASVTNINWINRSGETSSMIGNKKYWSAGYGTEARMLLLDFCFNERSFERLSALILENNIAFQKMVTKCGYIKEGVLRNSVFKNGKFKNQILMSVLRDEYISLKEKK